MGFDGSILWTVNGLDYEFTDLVTHINESLKNMKCAEQVR